MDEALKYLLPLSPWIGIPLAGAAIFMATWPHIYQAIKDFNATSRERQRLEVLKLRYEIEAIKKVNGITQLEEELQRGERLHKVVPPIALEVSLPTDSGLVVWRRLGYGALGGLVPSVYRVLLQLLTAPDGLVGSGPFYFVGVFLLCVIGGVSAALVVRRRSPRAVCVTVGLVVVVFIQISFAVVSSATLLPPRHP